MKLLISCVRDFVDVSAPADELAASLALRGFEVASIEPMGVGDAVIDFEVTANRPDCLSVLGLAREIATAYDLPLVRKTAAGAPPPFLDLATGESDDLRVTIHDEDLCPRYCAAVATLTPTTTPSWMANRLE